MLYSGMWRRVDVVWTDVSEERIAFSFRVENSSSEEPAWAGGCVFDWWLSLQPPAHAGSPLADFSTLKLDAPHRWCLHFIVVVGFECSQDPESYAGGSVATGRGTHTGQVKG
jgi:hypothetical protein